MSSAYRSLHINTSRERMEYSDFPMPEDYPDFPHHTQIAAYFDAYVDHFGFRDRIRFETGVEHVAPRRRRRLRRCATDTGETHGYDAVLVANGHHWDMRWPEPAFPGSDTTEIEQMHAHEYKNEEQLEGKRVVVLGMGNSAMDIAVDASYHASATYLAARRGAWIDPQVHRLASPSTAATRSSPTRGSPSRSSRLALMLALRQQVGKMEDYGLPKPDHKFGEAHPTISGRILDRIAHGAITPKPNIARLARARDRVRRRHARPRSTSSSTARATRSPSRSSTRTSSPRPTTTSSSSGASSTPSIGDVVFVGLLQPLGAIMPLAEAQGRWLADYLKGEYHLPAAPADARRHPRRPGGDAQALRLVQAPHRSRSTSTSTSTSSARSAGPAPSAPGWPASRCRSPPARGPENRRRRERRAGARARRREATKQANRAAILDAAQDVFADLGYGAATVRDIVRRTDLASGTFYNYFPDKEAVFRALLEESASEARALARAARRAAGSVEEFVADAYRAYFSFLAADPRLFLLVRRNAGTVSTQFAEPAFGVSVSELEEDLRAGVAAGVIPDHDVAYMAAAMVGTAFEVGVRMVEREPPDVDGATAFATRLFLGGMVALKKPAHRAER